MFLVPAAEAERFAFTLQILSINRMNDIAPGILSATVILLFVHRLILAEFLRKIWTDFDYLLCMD